MAGIWKFIDSMSTPLLAIGAGLLLLAPFFPEPHLLEKLRMLRAGTLAKPLDVADIFVHLSGIVVLALHLWRRFQKTRGG